MKPDIKEKTLESLIVQARQGNRQAFAKLYEKHFDQVYNYLLKRLNDEAQASDLTQQTFTNALKKISAYQVQSVPFIAWLYTIARNLLIDYYRQSERLVQLEDEVISLGDLASQASDLDQINRALGQLSSQEQQVVNLRLVEGLSLEETAQVLHKSKGATSTILYRALKKMRE